MSKNFFVAGTDTGVGKTLVTCAMLHKAQLQGLKSFGLKPLAAGAIETEDGWRNEDALAIAQYSSVKLPYSQINPVLLQDPLAPHIAAKNERRMVQLSRLEGICRGALMTAADIRLLEGAGGWRVPLNPMELYSGLPQSLQTPVVLVVGMRLGCLNHALLTAEAIVGDGLKIAGWVGNCIDPEMQALEDNIEALTALIPAPRLGIVPFSNKPTAEIAAQNIDLAPLLAFANKAL